MGDFKLNTIGSCFICMDTISSKVKSPVAETNCQFPYSYSLQRLSRYLQMDLGKVFSDKESIPQSLLTNVQRAKLKAGLCEDCVRLNDIFSRLHSQLEKIKMELISALELIYGKLLEAEPSHKITDTEGWTKFRDDPECGFDGKLDILKALRKEAIAKCSRKIQFTTPQVKVGRLSQETIAKLHKRRKLINKEFKGQSKIVCNSTNKDSQADVELKVKIKLECPSPSQISVQDELESNFESDNPDYENESDFNESEILSSVRPTTAETKGPTPPSSGGLNKSRRQISRTDLVPSGRKVVACPKCNRTFTRNHSLAYHLKIKDCLKKRVAELSRERKFRCQLCKGRFVSSEILKRHCNSVHFQLRKYGCQFCNVGFARKDHLRVHLRRVHRKTEDEINSTPDRLL